MRLNQENEERREKAANSEQTEPKGAEQRRDPRSDLPTMVILKVFSRDDGKKEAITLKGIAKDLSLSGVCIEIDERYVPIDIDQLTEQTVKMEIRFPEGTKTPYILGIVRWIKRKTAKGSSLLLAGIKFTDITEDNFQALKKFLGLGAGDQNLLWDLWESTFF